MPQEPQGADNTQLVDWFESSESQTQTSRDLMDRDVDYYNGKQLSDEEIKALKARKQPPIVINLIKPQIDYLAGVEKGQRVDPKAYPRTPNDDGAAYAATEGLRFVCDDLNYDNKRSELWKGLLKPGIAIAKVGAREDKEGRGPDLEVINYDRFFYDPHSSKPDFSDARYMGTVTWMDLDDAIAMYGKEHEDILTSTMRSEAGNQHYDDKPKWQVWGDAKRRRVRVCEIYYRMGGQWFEAVFTKGGSVSNRPSPFIDEDGKAENPIIAQSAYVDRDNNRYGIIREKVDMQDDYNKRRSKATHILNSRQVIADKGAVDDPQEARRLLAQPDGWIEKNRGMEIDINNNSGLEMGQFQLMQEAAQQLQKNDMKSAMIGSNDQSGRAKQAQQQAAFIEMGDLLDYLRDIDTRIFNKMWNRIKQFWDGPRWIRITDDPKNVQHLGLNVPVIDPNTGMPAVQNPIAEMNIDLRIEDAPDVTSLQGEELEMFTQALPLLMQAPPQWAQLYIEMMPHSRFKDKALKMLEEMSQPQQAPPDPMAEQMKQLAVAKEAATVDEIQSKTVLNEANAAIKGAEARIVPFKAMHEVAKDQADMQRPEAVR